MTEFVLTRPDGKTARFSAERFAQDGSGTRFYDAEGNVIASFADGQIATVRPVASPLKMRRDYGGHRHRNCDPRTAGRGGFLGGALSFAVTSLAQQVEALLAPSPGADIPVIEGTDG